jgi:hypothetical protein
VVLPYGKVPERLKGCPIPLKALVFAGNLPVSVFYSRRYRAIILGYFKLKK